MKLLARADLVEIDPSEVSLIAEDRDTLRI
jgi:hypothetical protein